VQFASNNLLLAIHTTRT